MIAGHEAEEDLDALKAELADVEDFMGVKNKTKEQ
jgi:C4-dicarboxylate transporter DctQ subunit